MAQPDGFIQGIFMDGVEYPDTIEVSEIPDITFIEGKIVKLFYNFETQVVEVRYEDEPIPPESQPSVEEQMASLRNELQATQDALDFVLMSMMT
jgi:hypothetical protein